MTIREFTDGLGKKITDMKTFTEPLQMAAFSTTEEMSRRIFDEGKKADGTDMTPGYSTIPLYLNPDVLKDMGIPGNIGAPMGKPKGEKKRGETVFKTGKKKGEKHKTKYLAGGYKELRNKLGRQTDYVDLKLSGELRMDFNNGESPTPRKINELEYQIRLDKPINQKKRSGMDDKYGIIFTPSEKEKEKFFNVIGFEFRKALSK